MPAATNDYRQQINSAYQSFSPFHFIYYNNEYPRHTKSNRPTECNALVSLSCCPFCKEHESEKESTRVFVCMCVCVR